MLNMVSRRETRRDAIARYVAEFAVDHTGNTPSLGDIARAFGINRQTVYTHTLKLVNEGRAQWIDGELVLVGSEFSPPPDTR